jgi:hypothetical protein
VGEKTKKVLEATRTMGAGLLSSSGGVAGATSIGVKNRVPQCCFPNSYKHLQTLPALLQNHSFSDAFFK